MELRSQEICHLATPTPFFIKDANKLHVKDSIEAYREAKRQGAHVFWNHPNWISQQRNGIATLTDLHKQLIEEDLLHGIEVVNDLTYSDEALQIALDNDLAIIGTSDIHGLVDWQFNIANGGHRPIMLVMAKEKTEASIKEAMDDHRTIAWFDNLLVGREHVLKPLVLASIEIGTAAYQGPSSVASFKLTNNSDAAYILKNTSEYSFHAESDVIILPAQSTKTLDVKTLEQKESFRLSFEVQNAITAPRKYVTIDLDILVDL